MCAISDGVIVAVLGLWFIPSIGNPVALRLALTCKMSISFGTQTPRVNEPWYNLGFLHLRHLLSGGCDYCGHLSSEIRCTTTTLLPNSGRILRW